MSSPYFETLLTHWKDLCHDGNVPFRSEIDPRLFPEVLESIFILENSAPEQFRIRHTGMMLCEMMGFEVRGQQASAMMQNKYREKMVLLLGQVLAKPSIAELTLVAQDLHDNIISLKMLLLPLRSDFGDVNRVLGCISTPVVPYAAPLRFGIAGQRISTLETTVKPMKGFAESQAAFGTDGLHEVVSNDNPTVESSPKRAKLRLASNRDQET